MKPIFLFSVQRSGSTLVQRVLAAHPNVATAAEPWILLPLMYALRDGGVYAEYSHRAMRHAVVDLCEALPGGRRRLLEEMGAFMLRVYEELGPGKTHFLDKTPRYHFIVDEIAQAFPDARFVFLWRNPLAIAASMMNTWAGGRWNLYRFRLDLERGVPGLVDACVRHRDRSIAVRYEALVSGGAAEWEPIFRHVGLDFDPAFLSEFARVELRGRMKDPTGIDRYSALSRGSLDKWPESWRNPMRRHWALRYLDHIGNARLGAMGYDPDELRRELRAAPPSAKHLASDVLRRTYGRIYRTAGDLIWSEPLNRLRQWRRTRATRPAPAVTKGTD